jgi:hypothetical protein
MERTTTRTRRLDAATAVACEVCGSPTTEPRRGLCLRCYRRKQRGSPALGGSCQVCGLTDRRVLRAVRRDSGIFCLCHNCGWIAERYCDEVAPLVEIRALVLHAGGRRTNLARRTIDRRRVVRRVVRRVALVDRRQAPRFPDKGDRRIAADRRAG